MEYRNLIPLKRLAEELGISEIDAYTLVELSNNEIVCTDNDYKIDNYVIDMAQITYLEYRPISEFAEHFNIAIEDIKYMCECNMEYDLPAYMKVKPAFLCGSYVLHESNMEDFADRYEAFVNEADGIMTKIDMGIDSDDELEELLERGSDVAYEQSPEVINADDYKVEDLDEQIIEEVIIIKEEQDKKTKQQLKDKKKKLFKGFRKAHEDEITRAVSARLRDEMHSKLKEKYGDNIPEELLSLLPIVPAHTVPEEPIKEDKTNTNTNDTLPKINTSPVSETVKEDKEGKENKDNKENKHGPESSASSVGAVSNEAYETDKNEKTYEPEEPEKPDKADKHDETKKQEYNNTNTEVANANTGNVEKPHSEKSQTETYDNGEKVAETGKVDIYSSVSVSAPAPASSVSQKTQNIQAPQAVENESKEDTPISMPTVSQFVQPEKTEEKHIETPSAVSVPCHSPVSTEHQEVSQEKVAETGKDEVKRKPFTEEKIENQTHSEDKPQSQIHETTSAPAPEPAKEGTIALVDKPYEVKETVKEASKKANMEEQDKKQEPIVEPRIDPVVEPHVEVKEPSVSTSESKETETTSHKFEDVVEPHKQPTESHIHSKEKDKEAPIHQEHFEEPAAPSSQTPPHIIQSNVDENSPSPLDKKKQEFDVSFKEKVAETGQKENSNYRDNVIDKTNTVVEAVEPAKSTHIPTPTPISTPTVENSSSNKEITSPKEEAFVRRDEPSKEKKDEAIITFPKEKEKSAEAFQGAQEHKEAETVITENKTKDPKKTEGLYKSSESKVSHNTTEKTPEVKPFTEDKDGKKEDNKSIFAHGYTENVKPSEKPKQVEETPKSSSVNTEKKTEKAQATQPEKKSEDKGIAPKKTESEATTQEHRKNIDETVIPNKEKKSDNKSMFADGAVIPASASASASAPSPSPSPAPAPAPAPKSAHSSQKDKSSADVSAKTTPTQTHSHSRTNTDANAHTSTSPSPSPSSARNDKKVVNTVVEEKRDVQDKYQPQKESQNEIEAKQHKTQTSQKTYGQGNKTTTQTPTTQTSGNQHLENKKPSSHKKEESNKTEKKPDENKSIFADGYLEHIKKEKETEQHKQDKTVSEVPHKADKAHKQPQSQPQPQSQSQSHPQPKTQTNTHTNTNTHTHTHTQSPASAAEKSRETETGNGGKHNVEFPKKEETSRSSISTTAPKSPASTASAASAASATVHTSMPVKPHSTTNTHRKDDKQANTAINKNQGHRGQSQRAEQNKSDTSTKNKNYVYKGKRNGENVGEKETTIKKNDFTKEVMETLLSKSSVSTTTTTTTPSSVSVSKPNNTEKKNTKSDNNTTPFFQSSPRGAMSPQEVLVRAAKGKKTTEKKSNTNTQPSGTRTTQAPQRAHTTTLQANKHTSTQKKTSSNGAKPTSRIISSREDGVPVLVGRYVRKADGTKIYIQEPLTPRPNYVSRRKPVNVCSVCRRSPCICKKETFKVPKARRRVSELRRKPPIVSTNGGGINKGVCAVCHQSPCICDKNDGAKTNKTTRYKVSKKHKSYLDPVERQKLLKAQREKKENLVAGTTSAILTSAIASTDVGYGAVHIYRTAKTVASVAGVFIPNTDTPTKSAMEKAMQKSIVQGTSSRGIYLQMTHKKAELGINKVNEMIEKHNLSVKDPAEKIGYLDPTLGLKVSTRDINLGSLSFKAYLQKNNIDIASLNEETVRGLLKDDFFKNNPERRAELLAHLKLNRYLADNKINLSALSSMEIALLLNETKDKTIKDLITNRTGVVGFRTKVNIEYRKKGNSVNITTKQIKESKSAIEKLLLKEGIVIHKRSTKHIADLLKLSTDDNIKTLLETYLALGNLEKSMSSISSNKFRSAGRAITSAMQSTLSKDETFAAMYQLTHNVENIIKVGRVGQTTFAIFLKRAKVLRAQLGKTRLGRRIGEGKQKVKEKVKEKAKKTLSPITSKAEQARNKRLENLRSRRKQAETRKNNKKVAFENKHPKITKTRKVVGKGLNKAKKGVSAVSKGVGTVGKGVGKVVGALGKVGKVLAAIWKYILIGIAIVAGVLLLANLIIWAVAKVGGLITNFFDNIWYDNIGDSEAFLALATLQDYDEKLFNAIEAVADSQDVSDVAGGKLLGFIQPDDWLKSRYTIKTPGTVYGKYGYEQHYYDSSGNEVARYSNAKDIFCTSYSAFDGKVSKWQQLWDDYKKYNAELWVKTHYCTTCGKQLTTEKLILEDTVDIHCHSSTLYACETGDCNGDGTPNTYVYYCNTGADSDYQSSAQKDTHWVYSTPLFKTSLKLDPQKNNTKYLCVIYGDGHSYPAQLYPQGEGCSYMNCDRTGSFEAVKIQGLKKDINGNKLGYYIPADDRFIGYHTCEDYAVSYCTGCTTIQHKDKELDDCSQIYYCSNYSMQSITFTNIPTLNNYMQPTGNTYPSYTLSYPNYNCGHTQKLTQTVRAGAMTEEGEYVFFDLTYTYEACAGHCASHTVCAGHASCQGHRTCNGHTMTYCTGHIDLSSTTTITSINDDKIFEFGDDVALKASQKFTERKKVWARKIYNDDWVDLYNIYFSNNAIPTPLSPLEIAQLNENANSLLTYVLQSVGIIPYHETYSKENGYSSRDDVSIFKQTTEPDSRGRILTGLNEETFGCYVLYNEGYVSKYYKSMSDAIRNASGLTSISKGELKPGDMAYNSSTGKTAFVVSVLPGGQYKVAICDNKKSSVVLTTGSLNIYNTFYSLNQQ